MLALVLSLLCVSLTTGHSDNQQYLLNATTPATKTWDYQLFVTSWPTSSCAGHSCIIGSYINYFTIHGLWPENYDGSYPSFCNSSYAFDMSKLSDLSYDMYHYWPDLYENGTSFWQHEWDKHGTCAIQSTAFSDEHSYFQTTLNLYKKYPIDTWLKNKGITPSSTTSYTWQQFFDAIKQGAGVEAAIECSKIDGIQQVYEIVICISDPDVKAITCPSNIQSSFSCPKSDPIWWLPIPK